MNRCESTFAFGFNEDFFVQGGAPDATEETDDDGETEGDTPCETGTLGTLKGEGAPKLVLREEGADSPFEDKAPLD